MLYFMGTELKLGNMEGVGVSAIGHFPLKKQQAGIELGQAQPKLGSNFSHIISGILARHLDFIK